MKKNKKKEKKTVKHKLYEKKSQFIQKNKKVLNNKYVPTDKYEILFKKILLNTEKIWLPDTSKKNNKVEYLSHSWFDITEYISEVKNPEHDIRIKVPLVNNLVKAEKIKMYPNNLQKKLLLNWMNAYVKMYNRTLKLFKKHRFDKTSITLDWKKVRTNYLKEAKQKIIDKSNIKIKGNNGKYINTQVNSHTLDFAIQDACAKYKSCLTNFKNGNIKYFRLRYLKQSKDTLVMKIEKNYINPKKNTFCPTVFTDPFNFQDNFQLKNVNCDFTIHYNYKKDEFTLLNPIKINQVKEHNIRESAGIDPGIRTFMTVFSNNKCIKIGNNLIEKVLKYTKKIDKLNNNETNKRPKIKKQLERKYYNKINNAIDDLHWKSINYLTNNFGNVLIGNMSTKSIISNKLDSQLDDNIKRVAQFMSLHKFRQRLAYKCLQKTIGYVDIDEAYTTMTCTRCCYKNDVKRKKEIFCKCCKLKIDRDFNGARNILLCGTDF